MSYVWRKWLARTFKGLRVDHPTSARARRCRPGLEPLEHRLAPATYTVIGVGDDNGVINQTGADTYTATTLRGAIIEANNKAGKDTINFSIGGGVLPTISVGSNNGNRLPDITDEVTIDGTTQPGYTSQPLIELEGSKLQVLGNGLRMLGGNSLVQGLSIHSFNSDGIVLTDKGNNTIRANYIGTDRSGQLLMGTGNEEQGIRILSADNLIGGPGVADGNLISANGNAGVGIMGNDALRNKVQRNLIGTDLNGTAALPNRTGVYIYESASNIIGGNFGASNPGNVISGNTEDGVWIIAGASTGNKLLNNLIGTKIDGKQALANGHNGVLVDGGASFNWIGGTQSDGLNVISGNGQRGVLIEGYNTHDNFVLGNFIGLEADGTTARGNTQEGVRIEDAYNNKIGGTQAGEGNVISGNGGAGVSIVNVGPELGARNNQVLGNLIGTDKTGAVARGNLEGVHVGAVSSQGNENIIGGSVQNARNIISGNNQHGVHITGSYVRVFGNFIGTNQAGNARLGNLLNGVLLSIASNNTIGGTLADERNVISGNGDGAAMLGEDGNGVSLRGTGTTANLIQNNYIGTNAAGDQLKNKYDGIYMDVVATGNTIGGAGADTRNYISGNGRYGIQVHGGNNTFAWNWVGYKPNEEPLLNTSGSKNDTGAGNTWTANTKLHP